MLKYGNKEFRNLEEQVRQNKDDIARHYAQDRVLADFGIKIVGQVDTANELPDPLTYEGNYGDAYAVGLAAPFTYYIWTRANNVSPIDYWFDFGDISIVGPQGPKGDTIIGPKGNPGNRWFVGSNPPTGGGYNIGDMYLNPTTGEVRRYQQIGSTYGWASVGNIKGATGAPGPRGENAGTIQIAAVRGKVPTVEVLSTLNPDDVPEGTAYLVGGHIPYDVYMPINGMWENIGVFDAGTIAVEGGVPLSVINMSNYLNAEGSNLGEWQDDYQDLYGDYGVVPVMRGDNYVYDFLTVSNGHGEDSDSMGGGVIPMTDDDGLIKGPTTEAQNYAVDDNGYVDFLPSFYFLVERFSTLAAGYTLHVVIRGADGRELAQFYKEGVASNASIEAYSGYQEFNFDDLQNLFTMLNLESGQTRRPIPVHGCVMEPIAGGAESPIFTITLDPAIRKIDIHYHSDQGHMEYLTLDAIGEFELYSTTSLFRDY